MRFFIVFTLFNLFLFGFSPARANQTSLHSDDPELSIWRIYHSETKRNGTGFFIGENRFVTCFHVILTILENGTSVENIVLSQDGNSHTLKIKQVLALSAPYDLALLETEEQVTNYLSIKEIPPESMEDLFLLAYPQGIFQKIIKTGNIFYEDSQFFFFPSNHLQIGGASGGPVLNSQREVVGVVNSTTLNMLNAVKQNHLRDFITGNKGLNCSDFININACIKKEMDNLKVLAEKGFPFAQYILALLYDNNNKGTEQDFKLAFKWRKKAAEQGYAPAQSELVFMYRHGRGTEQNLHRPFTGRTKL